MKAHISRVSRTCFYHLRRLRSIPHCLSREVTARLVSALIILRLDYCNAILANLPASTLAPLERVLSATVCMVMNLGSRDAGPVWAPLAADPVTDPVQTLPPPVACNRRSIPELLTSVAASPGHASMRSVGRQELDVPRTRLVSSERAFDVAAPKTCRPEYWTIQEAAQDFYSALHTPSVPYIASKQTIVGLLCCVLDCS